jgi:hypothetical protein
VQSQGDASERHHQSSVTGDLKPLGRGHLWAEALTGDIAQRHIAALGHVRLAENNSAPTCWGNRIFIRNNDYLWCIGDTEKPWAPGEATTKE